MKFCSFFCDCTLFSCKLFLYFVSIRYGRGEFAIVGLHADHIKLLLFISCERQSIAIVPALRLKAHMLTTNLTKMTENNINSKFVSL